VIACGVPVGGCGRAVANGGVPVAAKEGWSSPAQGREPAVERRSVAADEGKVMGEGWALTAGGESAPAERRKQPAEARSAGAERREKAPVCQQGGGRCPASGTGEKACDGMLTKRITGAL
jgi:hypothetical protein